MELTLGKAYFAYWLALVVFSLIIGKILVSFISGPYYEDMEYKNYLGTRAMDEYEDNEFDFSD